MTGNNIIVEKIGGGGSQDAASIIQNAERFAGEPDLMGVAFSGPGGRFGRATERMIQLTDQHRDDQDYDDVLEAAEEQFTAIAEGVGNLGIAHATMDEIRDALDQGYGYSWIRMRPEFFTRRAYDYVLNEAGVRTNLVNPVNSVFVTSNGRLDVPRTYRGLQREMRPDALNLLVGFAARRDDLTMDNMARGSTDLVGAAASGALKAQYPDREVVYILRKDDVKGIMRVSPKVYDGAEIADELSTGEVEALALGGSEVVYSAVLKLIDSTWSEGNGVIMDVRNTFDTAHSGTRVVPAAMRRDDPTRPIAGIASQAVDAYKWVDPAANDVPGSVASVSRVFADHGVSITDVQTGQGGVIETYVPSDKAREHQQLEKDLQALNNGAARVRIDKDHQLVVVVGDALRESRAYLDVIANISALATARNVNIGSLNHIDGEPNISFTVPAGSANDFMRTIYKAYFV